jgi:AcrR family transcriptional regulator
MKRGTKRAIVEATRRVLAAGGLKAVTMRRVAQEVGIAAPSIYRHFEDRDALVRAVVDDGSQLLASYLFRALEHAGPVEQLVATGVQYLRFAFEHEVVFGLMFGAWQERAIVGQSPPADPEQPSPGLQFLMDRVAACVRGAPSRDALMLLALEQWAVAHGLATLYLYAGGRQRMTRARYERAGAAILRRAALRLDAAVPARGGKP